MDKFCLRLSADPGKKWTVTESVVESLCESFSPKRLRAGEFYVLNRYIPAWAAEDISKQIVIPVCDQGEGLKRLIRPVIKNH